MTPQQLLDNMNAMLAARAALLGALQNNTETARQATVTLQTLIINEAPPADIQVAQCALDDANAQVATTAAQVPPAQANYEQAVADYNGYMSGSGQYGN